MYGRIGCMEVRHPQRGACYCLCLGVSIMVWRGKHPPKGGGVKKSLARGLVGSYEATTFMILRVKNYEL